jgi:hypothetical protein
MIETKKSEIELLKSEILLLKASIVIKDCIISGKYNEKALDITDMINDWKQRKLNEEKGHQFIAHRSTTDIFSDDMIGFGPLSVPPTIFYKKRKSNKVPFYYGLYSKKQLKKMGLQGEVFAPI